MADIDLALLERYLARDLSAEECRRVERWIAQSAEHRVLAETLRDALEPMAGEGDARARVWAMLEREMERRPVVRGGSGERAWPLARPTWEWRVAGLAAAAAVVAVVGGLLWRGVVSDPGRDRQEASAFQTIRTLPGERASFRLPDGTRVMLGVASTLRHSLGARSREVELEGQAYFDVVHDDRRPFVVRAGDLEARDLGTQFVVRAYREDPHAEVTVRQGKVALRAAAMVGLASGPRMTGSDHMAAGVVLPGQLGRISAAGLPAVEPGDTAAALGWTEGWLVFRGTPLREALPELSRWYDLDFRLADSSLGGRLLSGRFKDALTNGGLAALAASLGLGQVRAGRRVTFYSAIRTR